MNKYEHLSKPTAELDFHGTGILLPNEITQKVDTFIIESLKNNHTHILIITGKGLHSRDGAAVIKPLVMKHLRKHNKVKSVSTARRDRGGDGALEVKLYSIN